MQPNPQQLSALKAALFALCLVPLAQLGWLGWSDALGANPIELITRHLGKWTLNFLLITLAVTPLRHLTGWHWLIRLRRMLGLYAFFYALLHFLTYLWLDQFFDWASIVRDIAKRPFITTGFTAFLLLIPLAATSNAAMVKRLGGRRWTQLHRSVYAIALIGVAHYWWLVKKDVTLPLLYAVLLGALLGFRALRLAKERRRQLAAYSRSR
ncbi:MAG: Protein-methionine-sulfoxide reductase heme-binding subunit MsrQ [Rhodocyclaceae bacterium]|nr:MAG: sulfoxide reductase heme-binding subunit YedZ [Rhodocyclaceae bacterium]MBV6407652.1 Protein-methionine-sulfoxide reductase heme-binding subunit MsrQ [Rhodocyclaceae bacterium]CAG0930256.1 Magnetosome protein MamZ [Rhodocyclaceae bacterium]